MLAQDTISGVTITVGDKQSPRHCTISMKDDPTQKIELWVQDWPQIKATVDKLFAIVYHDENNNGGR